MFFGGHGPGLMSLKPSYVLSLAELDAGALPKAKFDEIKDKKDKDLEEEVYRLVICGDIELTW